MDDRPPPPPIPSFIQDDKPLIRGSAAWEEREQIRKLNGHKCLSFGRLYNAFSYKNRR